MEKEYIIMFINEDGKRRYLTVKSTSEEAIREKLAFMGENLISIHPTRR